MSRGNEAAGAPQAGAPQAGAPEAGTLTPESAMRDRRALMLMSIRDAGGHEPLAQDIFDALAIDIVEGRLRPGDTLNSVDLARRFGTSRTPVREALLQVYGPAQTDAEITTLKHIAGLWRGRRDLGDTDAYVRRLRRDTHRRRNAAS